jgi:hypothetical protein
MQTAFEKLIEYVHAESLVLDVGYGGLDGENTTNYLRARFKNLWGLNKNAEHVLAYRKLTGATDPVVLGIYPNDMSSIARHWDLIVLDQNIDGNLDFWSEQGLKMALSVVERKGYLITYVMLTDEYGNENMVHDRLREHRAFWWTADRFEKLPNWKLVDCAVEERRPEIMWVLLQATL